VIPNASIRLQHFCHDSAVGFLEFYEVFVDGRLDSRHGGVVNDPDVTVRHTFDLLVNAFNPDIASLDAVTGMIVDGRHRSLIMIAAGLYDNRALRRHLDQRRAENIALCKLAAIKRSTSWRQLLEPMIRELMSLPLLLQTLRDATDSQRWCVGFQIHAEALNGCTVSEAYGVDGLGRDLLVHHLVPIYCAGKPILALAIGRLVESGSLSFDDRIADVIGRPVHPGLREITG
jgi:hypothetical protein